MEPENQNTQPEPVVPVETAPVQPETGKSALASSGPIIGIVVLVIALLLGALYLWSSMLVPATTEPVVEETPVTTEPEEAPVLDPKTEAYGNTSASDEMTAIEADVESTDLEGLDAEMTAMEAEMEDFESE